MQSDGDAVYEQDIAREPGNIKSWIAYVGFRLKHGSIHEQAFVSAELWFIDGLILNVWQVMERACNQLPRSYKLWKLVSAVLLLRDLFSND